jgi:uncharacterized repeat protein (TIGR03803 family)
LTLAGTVLLAQSGSIRLAHQASGLPVTSELQPGRPQVSQAMPFAQRQSQSHARRRNATPQVQTGPEQVLYAFQGGNDGQSPNGLISDSKGNLYGTTEYGGTGTCTSPRGYPGCGTVFEVTPNGNGDWTETVLYSFQGGDDGVLPSSGLIFDQAGNLYGTTGAGGGNTNCDNGCGTVFELSPNQHGGWAESVLYSFRGGSDGDGAYPEGVIFDKSGNLYGPTADGGIDGCAINSNAYCGTVFELSPNGSGGWKENIIYAFPIFNAEGFSPNAGLVFDQSGNLYGTTLYGGPVGGCGNEGCGVVFELSPNGSGGWTETLLYSFPGGGSFPLAE